MVSRMAVHGALHGVHEQATFFGSFAYATGEVQVGEEWRLRRFVGNELNAP